jgi:hypothetical protein
MARTRVRCLTTCQGLRTYLCREAEVPWQLEEEQVEA